MKQLYKSNTNKKVAGVCGGIGEYFGIDPTIVRLGFVALSLLAGGGLAVYIIAAIIMPERAACSRTAEPRSLCRNVRHVPVPQMILSICEKNAVGFLLCNLKKH